MMGILKIPLPTLFQVRLGGRRNCPPKNTCLDEILREIIASRTVTENTHFRKNTLSNTYTYVYIYIHTYTSNIYVQLYIYVSF